MLANQPRCEAVREQARSYKTIRALVGPRPQDQELLSLILATRPLFKRERGQDETPPSAGTGGSLSLRERAGVRGRAAAQTVRNKSAGLPDQPLRCTENPAHAWLTGMISRVLMLMCGGWFMIQWMVSAMSADWIGSAPA